VSVLRELYEIFASVRHLRFSGPVILACAALYLIVGLVACGRPLSRKTPFLWGLLGVSGLGTLGGAVALIIASRRSVFAAVGLRPDEIGIVEGWRFMDAMEMGEAGLLLLACGLLWTAVFGSVSAGAAAVRAAREHRPPPALAMALVTMTGALGALLLWRSVLVARVVSQASAVSGLSSPEMTIAAMVESLIEASNRARAGARPAVAAALVLAVAMGGLLVAAARGQGRSPPGALEKVLCGGLFVTGVLAFAFTRAHAADCEARLPFEERGVFSTAVEQEWASQLPLVNRCDEQARERAGLSVALSSGTVKIGNQPLPERSTIAGILRERRGLHGELVPEATIPPLELYVEPGTPVAAMEPLVAAVRDASPEGALLPAVRPVETWPSRTLGTFPRKPRICFLPLAAGSRATWQDVAAEAATAWRTAP
jgi:hypothetical protein